MAIQYQHVNRYPYFISVLVLFMVFFITTLHAAESTGIQHRTYKFEIRLASHEKVDGWKSIAGDAPGQTLWISPEVTITNNDVAQAQPGQTSDDKFCVNLLLTEDGALKLARLTKANIGKFVAEMIDGQVTAVPQILAEIIGGHARLDGNFTEEEAKWIAEGIIVK